jgi:predicted RNase H-like nuclease (RuvC/YqgF family)
MALYPDGSTYSAAQYCQFKSNNKDEDKSSLSRNIMSSLNANWIERELNHVRKSYEDEIRLQDSEISELRSKLRQNNSYIHELQKRFEENLKMFYK